MKNFLLVILFAFSLFASAKPENTKTTFEDTVHLYQDTFAGLEGLDSLVGNYDVFINGENHTYLASNAKLWVKMIKYLNQKAGVRNVLIEYGYSSGWLINKYIQTGDTTLFNVLKSYSFKDLAYAYKDMMEYNKTLPEDKKLYFTGIDLERGIYSAAKVLGLLIPKDTEIPDSIELHVESLMSLISYNDNKIFNDNNEENTDYFNSYSSNSTIDRIILNFKQHTDDYRTLLGSNFGDFSKIIQGLEDVNTWTSYEDDNATHQFVYREKYLYNRYLEEYKAHGGKYFGQFGRCHSATSIQIENSCNWYNFKSLALRIQNSKELGTKLKVFSIGILYNESIEDEGWKNVQNHIDSLFTMVPENSIKLYDFRNDSLLNNKLADLFNYLFFNHYEPSENYIYGRDDDESISDLPETANSTFFALTGGMYGFDLKSLNQYFSDIMKNPFDGNMYFAGFSFGTIKKRATNVMSFNYLIRQNANANDSLGFKLNGFAFHSQSGFNLTPKSKHFSIFPAWGLGFSNLSLEVLQSTSTPSISNGFLGEEKFITYTNPAFTTDFSMTASCKIKKLITSLWGGYQFDLSNKKWLAEERMRKGPETSLRCWFAGLHLGLSI